MAVALSTVSAGSFFSVTAPVTSYVSKYLLTAVAAQTAGSVVAYSLDQHRVVELVNTTMVDVITPSVSTVLNYSV